MIQRSMLKILHKLEVQYDTDYLPGVTLHFNMAFFLPSDVV